MTIQARTVLTRLLPLCDRAELEWILRLMQDARAQLEAEKSDAQRIADLNGGLEMVRAALNRTRSGSEGQQKPLVLQAGWSQK